MKRKCTFAICILALVLSGCHSATVGIIGGSDGPTAIYINKNKDKHNKTDYEKDSVKMVRINGELYYETGEDFEVEMSRGTPDGNFKKTVGKYEIPQNDNESNFNDANAYQIGMQENTIEVLIDDDWEIFAKIDSNSDVLKYKYCYELEGELPNAKSESKYLVFANEENITFDDASYMLFGSDATKMKDIYVLPINDD